MKDREFLTWIHQRLLNVYGENSNADFMLNLSAIIAAMPDEQSPLSLDLAKAAITHALNAICDDPRKWWHLGRGTETYAKLTAAQAALTGVSVESVREAFVPDKHATEAYLAERHEHARLIEIGRQHDDGGAS